MKKPVAVIGEGWAPVASVAILVRQGIPVHWITGTTPYLLPPLYSLETSPGVGLWGELAQEFQMEFGEPQHGTFLKEFRNKAFRDPMWLKAGSREGQLDAKKKA